MRAPEPAELLVVGGGIVGALCAARARENYPDWAVTLVTAAQVGDGASRFTAGLCLPVARSIEQRAMVTDSEAYYRRHTGSGFLHRIEMIDVTADPAAWQARLVGVRAFSNGRPALPDCCRVSSGETALRYGGVLVVNAAGIAAALVGPGSGVCVQSRTDVRTLAHDGTVWNASVHSPQGPRTIRAHRVILATGPWPWPAGEGLPDGGGDELRTKRVAALELHLPDLTPGTCVHFVDDDIFLLATPRGRALASFYRSRWDVSPVGCDGTIDAADLEDGLAQLAARFHGSGPSVLGGRAFCDSYAPERHPLVMRGDHRIACVTGTSGSGVRFGPALAARALAAIEDL
ncbi:MULTISPECIES: NAD(P)/FAD-dependent oxidoreductase [Parafrankia]|uniref:NAD(P)/FAD-dependent oxidoreductase n=1 Tax=Parafrankia TaxID=2994362 RepID=UPI0013F4E26A|nr:MULTISPECIES: FAD-dependent oxidoreductase [Parafrankia]MBE3205809.1 FAD-binding oxidoreductase [Parafrankia sp. CH37]